MKATGLDTYLSTSYNLGWSTTSGSVSMLHLIMRPVLFSARFNVWSFYTQPEPSVTRISTQTLTFAELSALPLAYLAGYPYLFTLISLTGLLYKTPESIAEVDDETVDWKAVYLRAHTIEHHWRSGEVIRPKVTSCCKSV